MADRYDVQYDETGNARYFKIKSAQRSQPQLGLTAPSAQESAKDFLKENAGLLKLPGDSMRSLEARSSAAPVDEQESLRFESEKRLMDSTIVSYTQTMFGLPVYQAGISVTTLQPGNSVTSASSTLHYGVEATLPQNGLAPLGARTAASGAYDDLVRTAFPEYAANLRINRTRLMVYRYEAAKRQHLHQAHEEDSGWEAPAPTLPLAALPASIAEGGHYVAVEAMFTLALPEWGDMNWQSFIEVETGAVLYLRALVDGVTGLVFARDPITKSGNPASMPSAGAATLDPLRDNVTLNDLIPASAGVQALSGTFVQVAEVTLPVLAAPTESAPFNFAYPARTNNFAAVNAYYHCDRFFRIVSDLGFNVPTYFDGTSFPVPIDHRGKGTVMDMGNIRNADCRGNAFSNGIGSVNFALADIGDVANPIGIAADWRVVVHEIGGHGILWDHVNSPNFGFAHSAGDGIAAILNDNNSLAPDRFVTFPWVNIGRRHDRPVSGWGWGGANDVGGYSSEQILATSHFRLYRSIGGDSSYASRRDFASRTAAYLILRAVGQLTPATNPPSPLAWEQQLETADAGTWTSTNPAETHAGGAYHKVIRWAFEKQGLFRASGAPATVEGAAPPVDVYINDGRAGEYTYQPNHWSCTDIWNRLAPGAGGGVHQEPVVGQTNFAYVRIKNRGTQTATNVVVKGFHALPGVGLVYPNDWAPMTTPQLNAANLAAADNVGIIVGPFQWTPSQVGHECMFFSVSANGDAGNIDGGVVGPIPEWRLVPHDNNLGQRNVHPVAPELAEVKWEGLPFWIRNHGKKSVRASVKIHTPRWLAKLGWKFGVVADGKSKLAVKAGDKLMVAMSLVKKGEPVDHEFLFKQKDRNIVVTVLLNGAPAGGMTFQIAGKQIG